MSGFLGKNKLLSFLVLFGTSLLLFVLYLYIYASVLGWELPRTRILERRNLELKARSRALSRDMEAYSERLAILEMRDESVFRPIFGLYPLPEAVRFSGLGGKERYDSLKSADRQGEVWVTRLKADILGKRAFIQSRSYDEVEKMLKNADNMATSIPAILPIVPDSDNYRISSAYGRRLHPVLGYWKMHTGIDLAMQPGNAVYATGDAIVESVRIERGGYGRQVTLDHGFGYKTRYAHLKTIMVTEGMKVRRGDKIAVSGNSGLSSGPHLHYEVIYRGKNVNPYHYFDREIPVEKYMEMISKEDNMDENYVHPMHKGKASAKSGKSSKSRVSSKGGKKK